MNAPADFVEDDISLSFPIIRQKVPHFEVVKYNNSWQLTVILFSRATREPSMPDKVFITYSHDDTEFQERIVDKLDYCGLDVVLDDRILGPGDDFLDLFEEIDSSDVLIPILSENSVESNWVQEELRVAILDQIDEDVNIIPIIHEDFEYSKVMDELPVKFSKPLNARYVGRFDSGDFDKEFNSLAQNINELVSDNELYEEYLSNKSENPFRRTRTEYFESSQLIADTFAEPVNTSYGEIANLKPTLIEGGRGSGKTMILKSLQARINILMNGGGGYEESDEDFFGAYCKLTRGSFSTQSDRITNHLDIDTASTIYVDEITIRLLSTLLDEIQYSINHNLLKIDDFQEKSIVSKLDDYLGLSSDKETFAGLQNRLKSELDQIDEYVQRKILQEDPDYDGPFLDQTAIGDVSEIIADQLPGDSTNIYYLIDEYEVLKDFQKVVVNTLVKRSEQNKYSFKLASKKPGFSESQTLEDEELEEYNDYSSVDLDYNISDPQERSNYKKLLVEISKNLLSNEGYSEKNVENILEERDRFGDNSLEEIDAEIRDLKDISESEWENLPEDKINTRRDHYGVAAWYSLLDSNEHRNFGGLDDLALLSSGITRFYLELIGFSFYCAKENEASPMKEDGITVDHQTRAAHTVSDFFLDYIHDNISEYGPKIQQMVLDLGDIFEQKLHNHTSEPEAARISIRDPERLSSSSINDLLDSAEEHSIIQRRNGRGGMRPRGKNERQLLEYTLNRIYTPSLRVSPRYRWRTMFQVEDLEQLVNSESRAKKKRELINGVKMGGTDEAQSSVEDF